MSTIVPIQPTVAPAPWPASVPLTSLPLRRITVDEYDRIGESGALDEPERVELIDGYMVTTMPKSAEHGYSAKRVVKALDRILPPGWTWQFEQPVRIPDFDEPQPDLWVARGSDEDYRHRIPGPADLSLVAEVSLTTLAIDRGPKLSAYARAGIPVYWIINLAERQVEVYTGPGPGAYQTRVDYKPGQAVPVLIDGRHLGDIAVNDILP